MVVSHTYLPLMYCCNQNLFVNFQQPPKNAFRSQIHARMCVLFLLHGCICMYARMYRSNRIHPGDVLCCLGYSKHLSVT